MSAYGQGPYGQGAYGIGSGGAPVPGPEGTALAKVKRLGATGQRPVMDDDTALAILLDYRLADLQGNAPGSADWAPTYDVNGAVAEVWRTKAGQVAGDFTFTADDATYNKGDVLANMAAMEAKYAAMSTSDREARRGGASTLDVAGTNGPINTLDRVARQVIP